MHELCDFILSDAQWRRRQNSGSNNIIRQCQAPHVYVHKLFFALCVVVNVDNTQLCEQFLAAMAKNVDNETLMRKRTSYPLAIKRKHTSY